MKKILIIALIPIFVSGQQHPFFSEYGEGTSFTKWIEIYNPTPNDINLDDYRYNFCWNGCDDMQWEFSIAFDSSFILQSGETYVISHSDAINLITDVANQTTNILREFEIFLQDGYEYREHLRLKYCYLLIQFS